MQFHELFRAMSPGLADSILSFLYTEQKEAYRGAIETLAPQQKLRPVFVLRKPLQERNRWFTGMLARRQNENLAMNVVQIWLTSAHKGMLVEFLDALGIVHDGDGMVEDLPVAPEMLPTAVDALLEKYPGEVVAVYFHALLNGSPEGWEPLATLLRTDSRLALPGAP